MSRIILTIIAATTIAVSAFAEERVNVDSLLVCIDQAIDQADVYLTEKNKKIELIEKQLSTTKSGGLEEYNLYRQLLGEYIAFVNDSAISCLQHCLEIAEQMGREDLKVQTMVGMAYQYAGTGFYTEAKHYFDQVPKHYLVGDLKKTYYSGLNHLYGEMGFYTKDPLLKKQYFRMSDSYRDSVFAVIDVTSTSYASLKSMVFNNKGMCDSAMVYSDKWLVQVKPDTRQYAIMAFFRSEIYRKMENVEMRKYWLAQSALCDIRGAVMDQSALWSLARVLSEEGDVERAYRYIDFSWSCISRFSTHMRGWLVAPIVTMISDNYKQKLEEANRRLVWTLVIISLLTVFLLASLINVSRKRKQLAAAREELHEANEELKEKNGELSALNDQLSAVNEQLSTLNAQLKDSNRVKDEYITKFLSMCSGYIDKLDGYRLKVNRKLKAAQYAELQKMTSSEQMREDELNELFDNFDAVFLHLFPNFVEEFNALLTPEGQIIPTEPGRLTTNLRIFALIRLGIEESSRIAEFLRYSPNSIYNYRARIKGKAIVERDKFEEKVKEIGLS